MQSTISKVTENPMRALYSKAPATPKLPYCHKSLVPSFSPKSLPNFPKFQHPSLKNSISLHNQRRKPTKLTITKASMEAPTATTQTEEAKNKPFSVLFVCLGNICRSPAAEGVFRHLVNQKGLDNKFYIDSAGTINYHEGNQADPRMRAASARRGIEITSISRKIRPSDFKEFDLILAMDKQNREDILFAFENWSYKEALPADATKKVRLMCSYCKRHNESEVPDPYYGGPQGFEKVLDLLEDACESLLDSILAETSHLSSA